MRNTDFICDIIEQRSLVVAKKIFETQFFDRYFEDQTQTYQDMAGALVKGWLYDIFLDTRFNADHPDIEWMAQKIHAFTLFKNTKEYANEPEIYKEACRNGANIALSNILPSIKSSYNIVQSTASPTGAGSWFQRTISSVRDIFANAGG